MALPSDLLHNGSTRLRALEPSDVDQVVQWENNPEHWAVTGTSAPYSRAALEALCQGHQDLYTAGQLRWIIEENGRVVGAVDLVDQQHGRVRPQRRQQRAFQEEPLVVELVLQRIGVGALSTTGGLCGAQVQQLQATGFANSTSYEVLATMLGNFLLTSEPEKKSVPVLPL